MTVAPSRLSGHGRAGDSVAVNGVCLTLLDGGELMRFDASVETLSRTLLGEYEPGRQVNLEPALTLSTPLGGHLVSGHVDGVATIEQIRASARSTIFRFAAARALSRFIAEKGSIAVDGISLTVNWVEDAADAVLFEVNIVPHTLSHTNLGSLEQGARVHLEVDQVARYLDRIQRAAEA
jgi:riboflavin synthase